MLPENIDTNEIREAVQDRQPSPQLPSDLGEDVPAEQPGEPNLVDFMRRQATRFSMMQQEIESLRNEITSLKGVQGNGQVQENGSQHQNKPSFAEYIPMILEIAKPFLNQFAEMMPMAMAEKDERPSDPYDDIDRQIGRQVREEYYRQKYGIRQPRGPQRYPRKGYLDKNLH